MSPVFVSKATSSPGRGETKTARPRTGGVADAVPDSADQRTSPVTRPTQWSLPSSVAKTRSSAPTDAGATLTVPSTRYRITSAPVSAAASARSF